MRKTQDCIREIQKNQTEAVLNGQLHKIEGQALNELKIAIEQACEKGASNSVMPSTFVTVGSPRNSQKNVAAGLLSTWHTQCNARRLSWAHAQ